MGPPYTVPPPHSQSAITGLQQHQPVAGSSLRPGATDDVRKEKRRKDFSKPTREIGDRRDERHFNETVSALHHATQILLAHPETSDHYLLRLFPLTIERSSLTAQLDFEERYAIDCAHVAYNDEREQVEEEWRRGREKVRERLLEGIEERRRSAREEKEAEGIICDVALDLHSRLPVTRNLRNKLGTSPPPAPHSGHGSNPTLLSSTGVANLNGSGLAANLPITMGPFLNPHSLSVDDLPSPFPHPLTSTHIPHSSGGVGFSTSGGASTGSVLLTGGAKRKVKGSGAHQGQAVGGLGKSLLVLNTTRDNDLESDLSEIRRGNKRRRGTAAVTATRTIS